MIFGFFLFSHRWRWFTFFLLFCYFFAKQQTNDKFGNFFFKFSRLHLITVAKSWWNLTWICWKSLKLTPSIYFFAKQLFSSPFLPLSRQSNDKFGGFFLKFSKASPYYRGKKLVEFDLENGKNTCFPSFLKFTLFAKLFFLTFNFFWTLLKNVQCQGIKSFKIIEWMKTFKTNYIQSFQLGLIKHGKKNAFWY